MNTTEITAEMTSVPYLERSCEEMSQITNPLNILRNISSKCNFIAKFSSCFGFKAEVQFCFCFNVKRFCLNNDKGYFKSSIDCSKLKDPAEPILALPDGIYECYMEFEIMEMCFGWDRSKRNCYCAGMRSSCTPEEYETFKNRLKYRRLQIIRGTTKVNFDAWKTLNIITICIFSVNII